MGDERPVRDTPRVTSRSVWKANSTIDLAGPLPPDAERVITEAATLTRAEIRALDLAESDRADFRLVAWDLLRDRLGGRTSSSMLFDARGRAWASVNRSLVTLGVEPLPGDDYWRVTTGFGWGAARAARFAACALVAPREVDPEIAELLMRPWLARTGSVAPR